MLMMDSDTGDTATTIMSLDHPVYDTKRSVLTFFVQVHAIGDSFPVRAGGVVDTFLMEPAAYVPSVCP
jgi:hypothetical protein